MDQFFADAVRINEYLGSERISFYQMVANQLPCRRGQWVLDIGCGPGTLLNILHERYGVRGVGVDQSASAGQWVRKRYPEIEFLVADIYRPPFPLASFDVVVATEVLEHLLYPARAIEATLPLIRPGGRLFATVPDGRTDTFAGHINFWSYESFGVFAEPFGNAAVQRLSDGSLAMVLTR